jgi:hypothetical protein
LFVKDGGARDNGLRIELHDNTPSWDPEDVGKIARTKVVYYYINGDNTLLDQKLAQLHSFDLTSI